MTLKAKDLSPDQKMVIESLLGRSIAENEEISIRATTSPSVPEWLQTSWKSAQEQGLDQLSVEEIDAEIAAARKLGAMIRVVLDTNILISALLQPQGLPARTFVMVLAGTTAQLCVSGDVYAEGPSRLVSHAMSVRTNVLTIADIDHILSWSRPAMRFEWDKQKNRQNPRKHNVRFETAMLVFDDRYALTQRDFTFEDEERWITVGAIRPGSSLLVVHTFYEKQGEESSVSFRLAQLSRTKGGPMRKLTREQKRDIRAIAAKRDEDIDSSDAPPLLDWSGAEIGKFYRPKKKPVTLRLDSDIIAWLKAGGRGYQTKANWLLRNAMLHFTNEANVGRRKMAARRTKPRGRREHE